MTAESDPHALETVSWVGDAATGHVRLIDQTLLPNDFRLIDLTNVEGVWEAIKTLRVRGAPAIGVAAAFGSVIGARGNGLDDARRVGEALREATTYLRTSRPTAVNLFWALDRMDRVAVSTAGDAWTLLNALLNEARAIADEDKAMCRAIGRHGAGLLDPSRGILTHCNAGGLATADYGTALGVIFSAVERWGDAIHVFVDETRPLLQGARLTAWELTRRGIPATLICDNMAAQVMKEGRIGGVVVGADRIAANGDTANKIGTYGVAVLARAHGIPFYVAAPSSTFDLSIQSGADIPIEQRDTKEVTHGFGRHTAPDGIAVYNPAFDVTPAELIAAIITERGVISPVNESEVRAHLAPAN